ncbi:MAG: hypothetical protein CFE28_00910 [Alphaproteobacteria bacterium PA2]|nr:MAG: hypothetical protein CFE28_00910 [Alphaproteobacteria bacterium PA2]
MMSYRENLRAYFLYRIEKLQRQIEMIDAGVIKTFEQKTSQPRRTDTTEQSRLIAVDGVTKYSALVKLNSLTAKIF